MEEVRTRIIDRLNADAAQRSALVPGGVHPGRIRPGSGPGATPDAFFVALGDPAGIVQLRPALSVIGPNEVEPPDGPGTLRNGFVRIFAYVPDDAAGRAKLDPIDAWLLARLDGWQTTLGSGRALTVQALELSEALGSDEIGGALVRFRRFVCEYLR